MNRNTNLEVLRILSMLLIVMHHYAVHSNFHLDASTISGNELLISFLYSGGKLGVNCFVLITGFFLVKSSFKIEKLIKIWFQIFLYSVSIYIFFVLFGMIDFDIEQATKSFFPVIFNQYWFATSYLILYTLSPYLNSLIKGISQGQHFNLIILLVTIWSFIPTFTTARLDFSSIGWFCTLYIISAYIRLYPSRWFDNCKKNIFFAALAYTLILLSVLTFNILGLRYHIFGAKATYFTSMNMLPLLFCSITLFLGFKNLNIRNNKIINYISSSIFGVYLIHDNHFVRHYLWIDLLKSESFYDSPFLFFHAIASIISVFLVCVAIDKIRYIFIEKPSLKFIDIFSNEVSIKLHHLKRTAYNLTEQTLK